MNIEAVNTVSVIGWSKTGISLCNLLLSLGKKVLVSESRRREDFPPALIDKFASAGVSFEFGGHSKDFIKNSQLMITSPGVDVSRSQTGKISKELGIMCVGEIEFCFWLTKAKFIAITGTNGKTTTTFLTYRTLKEKRKRVFLGGNIGIPVSSFILNTKAGDLIVLEISSFQLETIIEFRPLVSALLNIEPDHLDRYEDFKDYLRAKTYIFKNQKEDDWAVLNKKIDFRSDIEKSINAKIVYFGDEFENDNLSCVYRIGQIFGLSKLDCAKVFSSFDGLPHRLQLVRRLNGVKFINDSKATNPSSTIWALKNIKEKIILIAGGKDKGLGYSSIFPYLKRVKKINLFGQAAQKINEEVSPKIDTQIFSTLEEAVKASFSQAKEGDVVLLSPMCSSFDMFSSYRERGDKFIEIVKKI